MEPSDSKPCQMPRGPSPSHFDVPSLLHQENIDFPKTPDFGQSTQTAVELPKIDICQNWPEGVLGDVSSCLEYKFDKRIPMGSVPNCQKEILNRDAKRNSRFTRKPWIIKILERCLLVAKMVLYKFPNDIPLQLSTLHVVNGQFIFHQNTWMPIAQTPEPPSKKLLHKFTY